MDPLTHTLMGAVLARTGPNRRAAYATAAMAIAAEFPDIDTVWGLAGPVTGFQHHRGITHTFLGVPFEAGVLVGAFWLFQRWRDARKRHSADEPFGSAGFQARGSAPVHWGALYGFVLVALLSHLFLDWMNNYGLRPLFPFRPQWSAASVLFIFDPLLFVLLIAALTLPALFRLVGKEVGAATSRFAPRRWALGALVVIALYLGLRAVEHARAVALVADESADAEAGGGGPVLTPRSLTVSPDPFSPFRWHAAVDFGPFLQLATVDTRQSQVSLGDERLDKPPFSPALAAALRSPLGRVYRDWSAMPALSVSLGENGSNTVVFLRDPRFMGDVPLLNRSGVPPLSGTVELDTSNHVVGETLDGREQRGELQ